MKKILVTGATGFIGNYVVSELLSKGFDVVATSRDKEKAHKKEWYSSVRYIPLDLHNTDPLVNYFDFFTEPDLLVDLAWEGLPNYTSLFHFENNLPSHYQFIKNMVERGLKDVAVTGTCFEYGMKSGSLREDIYPEPANPYALAKDTLRKFLECMQTVTPFSLKWIRLFYMYGQGQSEKSLFSQLEKALENGEKSFNMSRGDQIRDFLPVQKVAEYIVAIATQDRVQGVVNCCSNNPDSVKDFIKKYLKDRNKHIELNLGYYPYTAYEPMEFWGDNNKLKTILKNE